MGAREYHRPALERRATIAALLSVDTVHRTNSICAAFGIVMTDRYSPFEVRIHVSDDRVRQRIDVAACTSRPLSVHKVGVRSAKLHSGTSMISVPCEPTPDVRSVCEISLSIPRLVSSEIPYISVSTAPGKVILSQFTIF